VVTNTGNVTLTNILVEDPLTGFIHTIASLAPGASEQLTTTLDITQQHINDGSVTNTATATTTYNGQDVSDSDEATITALANPSIHVEKTADPATYTAPGNVITYTIVVTNDGNVTLTNVRVTDPLTGLDTTIASLEPGVSETYTQSLTITQAHINAGSVTNTASASTTYNGVPVEDSDDAVVTAEQNPGLSISKTASPLTYSAAGDVITYTIVVTNTGNVTLTNLRLTDPLTGLDTTIPSLVPGSSLTYTETYTIEQDDINNGQVDNTATVTAIFGSDTLTDSDDASVTAIRNAEIVVVKTANPLVYESAGEVITYVITVTNTGNLTLTNVVVVDDLTGDEWTIPELSPDETEQFTVTYTIIQEDVDRGEVVNVASASGTDPDGNTVSDEDDARVSSTAEPELDIVKTPNVSSYERIGQVITYTLTVTNNGNVTLTNVVVTDPLTGFTSPPFDLAPGEVRTFTTPYTTVQADLNRGHISNTARVTGVDPNGVTVSDEDTARVNAVQLPGISIQKTADPLTFTDAGNVITYTLIIRNTGNVELLDVVVYDPLIGFSSNLGTLQAGQTITIPNLTYTTTQADLNAGGVGNTAYTEGNSSSGQRVTASASANVRALPRLALYLEKEALQPNFGYVGDPIDFQFILTNTGNVTLYNIVVFDQDLSVYIEDNLIPELRPGQSVTLTARYFVTQEDLINGEYVNLAYATGKPANYPEVESNWATERVPARFIHIEANDDDATDNPIQGYFGGVAIGNVLSNDRYRFEPIVPSHVNGIILSQVTQPVDESGNPTDGIVLDTTMGSPTYGQVTILPGTPGGTYTFTYRICEVLNVVNCDEAVVTVVVLPPADLAIEKTAHADQVHAGELIHYTLTVFNHGPGTAENVEVEDVFDGRLEVESWTASQGSWTDPIWSVGDLAPGDSATITISARVNPDTDNGVIIPNEATVGSDTFDPDESNNTDRVDVGITTSADLAITKVADPEPVIAGDEMTYTITVTNNGPSNALDVVMEDVIPALLSVVSVDVSTGTWSAPHWTIGTLAVGDTVTMTITATTESSLAAGTEIVNVASVSSTTPDPDHENNVATVVSNVVTVADLSVTKDAVNDPGIAGEELVYMVTVTNHGPSDAQNIEVVDHLPAQMAYISHEGTGVYDPSDHSLTWILDMLAAGESHTFYVTVMISPDTPHDSNVVNTAEVSSDTDDNDESNNIVTHPMRIQAVADLAVTKVADVDTLVAGETIVYTITVTNNGPSDAQNVRLTDNLPSGLTFVSADFTVGSFAYPVWDIGTLPLGETVTLQITASSDPALPEGHRLTNTAVVSSTTTDPVDHNNRASVTTPVTTVADLEVSKVSMTDEVIAGTDDLAVYEITVTNLGPSDAANVRLYDDMTADYTGAEFSTDGGNTWQAWVDPFRYGNLPVGESFTILIRASVLSHVVSGVVNTAVVESDTEDPNLDNNESSASTPVRAIADMEIKIIDVAPSYNPFAGTTITYTLAVVNNGPSDAQHTVVTNELPNELLFVTTDHGGTPFDKLLTWGLGTMAVGDTVIITLVTNLPGWVQPGTIVPNIVEVMSQTFDPDLTNNIDMAEIEVQAEADLEIVKSAPVFSAVAGEEVVYTLRITNNGPSHAYDVVVEDQLPEGVTFVEASHNGFYIPGTHSVTWFIGEMAQDETISLTLTVRLIRTLLAEDQLVNFAKIFSLTNRPPDPYLENNESDYTIWVDMPLRLFIPEGFSPDGDGINDTFVIGGLFDLYPQNKITIIDRWGQFVFSAEPYHENWWDGKNFRGEDMPPGTYYYVLELGPGNSPIRGFIYLAR
jgi:uncharacterized repeat protein (TIGR01451 family)/gliding motility-associated-like protein